MFRVILGYIVKWEEKEEVRKTVREVKAAALTSSEDRPGRMTSSEERPGRLAGRLDVGVRDERGVAVCLDCVKGGMELPYLE